MDENGNLEFTQHTATNQPMKAGGQQTTKQTTNQD
jgi:hypothetical protein